MKSEIDAVSLSGLQKTHRRFSAAAHSYDASGVPWYGTHSRSMARWPHLLLLLFVAASHKTIKVLIDAALPLIHERSFDSSLVVVLGIC